MRIKEVTSRYIKFDNNVKITYHDRFLLYPSFGEIEKSAFEYDFEESLDFEAVREKGFFKGFRFGNKNKKMFFMPVCTLLSGYYSDDVDILYNEEVVLDYLHQVSIT